MHRMTDTTYEPLPPPDNGSDPNVELPVLISVPQAFSARLPSQRVLDQLAQFEGMSFGDLATTQPFRIVAYRALLRDFPGRDPRSLWAHAYDVEVEVTDADPFSSPSTMLGQSSAGSGG
jgi:hypothetical protein